MRYTLPKIARLKSKKQIEFLFSEGKSIKKYPLVMVYVPISIDEPVMLKVGFSVSKKRFKLAVARNRMKRLMREAYRLNQNSVKTTDGQKYACMFLYIGGEELPFKELHTAMVKLLDKFNALNHTE